MAIRPQILTTALYAGPESAVEVSLLLGFTGDNYLMQRYEFLPFSFGSRLMTFVVRPQIPHDIYFPKPIGGLGSTGFS